MRRQIGVALVAVVMCVAAVILGCQQSAAPEKGAGSGKEAPRVATPATDSAGWGTLRGRVVFAGDKLPESSPLKVEKDMEHCLAKGAIKSEQWVVNPQNRGVRWAVVFLKPAKGKKLAVHETLRKPNQDEVVIDQPQCAFEPHVLAMREGQNLLAKNPSPVPHNVMFKGFKNSANVQIPPGQSHVFRPELESGAIKLGCGAHAWMEGYLWVFDHPYFAVTDGDGNFEIKLAPSGAQNLVVWHEVPEYVPDPKGQPVEIKPDGTTDVGELMIKPKN